MTENRPAPDRGRLARNPPSTAPKLWGWWTRHKLQILQDYLQAFATASKSVPHRIYLDLFAGWPKSISRETDEPILGSVHQALGADPPFTRLCLFELQEKAQRLEAEIRSAYRGRAGISVYPGDCNVTIDQALRELWPVRFFPTFAFIDQFDAEVSWSTLEKIAGFRVGKTKAEMWILFATAQYPRGLNIHGPEMNAGYGSSLTVMIGSDEWRPIVEARRRGILTATDARAEWVNLMRWRLEKRLGYASSYPFTMKNTGGQDLYDMIFVTDHPAGDRIMRSLYAKAAARQPAMRQHALALRRDDRLSKLGIEPMFSVTEDMVSAPAEAYVPEPVTEPYRLQM